MRFLAIYMTASVIALCICMVLFKSASEADSKEAGHQKDDDRQKHFQE